MACVVLLLSCKVTESDKTILIAFEQIGNDTSSVYVGI